MPEFDVLDLIDMVRENPPPALIEYYVPTEDKCPYCGEERKSRFNHGSYRMVKADPNIEIKFRTRNGKKVVLLGKKVCTNDCLEKELTKIIKTESPVALSIIKQFALENDFEHGTAFKLDSNGYRNNALMFWDDKKKIVVPADSDLNGGNGGVPINFLIGDGDFTPTYWEDDFLSGVVESYPNMKLIVEMRNYAAAHPEDEKMSLEINGKSFDIKYKPAEMSGQWESCTLMLRRGNIFANPGDKRARNTIKNADAAALREAEEHVAAKVPTPKNVLAPNTPEEVAAKEVDKKAALNNYGRALHAARQFPSFSRAKRQAHSQAKKNYLAARTAINKRRTIKASNVNKNTNAGLNRLAAMKGLKAQHSPNSNAWKALNAEEHNLIMKHFGGKKTRKNRKRIY